MAKIPEVNIVSFWNLSNDELPENALSGRIIIVEESNDMYVGTGLESPLLKISDVQVIESINELDDKDNSLSILYILASTGELYFFNHKIPMKCNGLGIIGVYKKYTDLPIINSTEGLFCVLEDETSNNNSALYMYTNNIYNRLQYSNFDINLFYQFKVGSVYIPATNYNNMISINTDNTLITSVYENSITIRQKLRSDNILTREESDLVSEQLAIFPMAMNVAYTSIVHGEIFVLGYSSNGTNFINRIYKYNRIDGWVLLSTNQIPYSAGFQYAIFSYNDKIYVCGGYNTSYVANNTLYEFDPLTLTFTQKSNMNLARCGFCYTINNNRLWVFGGRSKYNYNTPLQSVEYYDFDTDTWTLLDDVYNTPIIFFNGSAFSIGNEIHLLNASSNSTHYTFNTNTLSYTKKSYAPFNAQYNGVIETSYETIFILVRGVIYTYNNSTDSWLQCGSLKYTSMSPYACIDNETNTIYTVGHYSTYTISSSRYLETFQIFHKDIENDCQSTLRLPLNNKKLISDIDYARSVISLTNGYIEYVCAGVVSEHIDIIIQNFKYI